MNPSPLFRQQSTFIPQQTSQASGRAIYYNIFFILGNVVLVGTVVAWIALFGYRFYLDQTIETLQDNLTTSSQKAISDKDQEKINEFKVLDTRLTVGPMLVDNHITLEPVFALLDDFTLTNSVRFNNFKYSLSDQGVYAITALGSAASFSSLAYQEKVFKDDTASSSVSNVTFSNFSLDDKTGNVKFTLNFTVQPTFLLLKNTLQREESSLIENPAVDTLESELENEVIE